MPSLFSPNKFSYNSYKDIKSEPNVQIKTLFKYQFSLGLMLTLFSMSLLANEQAVVTPNKSIQPFTQAEIQTALQNMQKEMNQNIETWAKSLDQNDFERTWRGRQLIKTKRQEVCGIYQDVVNDMYRMAEANRARLSVNGQKLLQDRDAFIQSLGFKDNLIDTKMGFNCRLR